MAPGGPGLGIELIDVIEPLPAFTVFINPGFGPAKRRMMIPKVVPGPACVKPKTSTGSPPTLASTPLATIVVQAALVSTMSRSLAEPGAPLTEKKGWSCGIPTNLRSI